MAKSIEIKENYCFAWSNTSLSKIASVTNTRIFVWTVIVECFLFRNYPCILSHCSVRFCIDSSIEQIQEDAQIILSKLTYWDHFDESIRYDQY